jgi:hypothetical protein
MAPKNPQPTSTKTMSGGPLLRQLQDIIEEGSRTSKEMMARAETLDKLSDQAWVINCMILYMEGDAPPPDQLDKLRPPPIKLTETGGTDQVGEYLRGTFIALRSFLSEACQSKAKDKAESAQLNALLSSAAVSTVAPPTEERITAEELSELLDLSIPGPDGNIKPQSTKSKSVRRRRTSYMFS